MSDLVKADDLIKKLIQSAQDKTEVQESGLVTLSQCSDETGVFSLDLSKSFTNPNPVQKGQDLTINVFGSVSSSV